MLLQYFTPATLEEMYKDLDEARIDLLRNTNDNNVADNTAKYHQLTNQVLAIDAQYNALTGGDLWLKVTLEDLWK